MDKKKKVDKVEKKVVKEIKKINKPKKKTPIKKKNNETFAKNVIEKQSVENKKQEPFLENIEKIKEKKNRKIVQTLELIVIVIFYVIMLFLLCNRTFFRRNYKTSKININIPLLMFYKKDDGNKLVMKTLRKSQYVKDFFDEELKGMTQYNCNNHTFYYDNENHFAIYDIEIDKDFAIKTVTISYATGDADCLCNSNAVGEEAEKMCK